MKRQLYSAIIVYTMCLLLFDGLASTSEAVYEGSANANMWIRRYERKEQFGKAALWREAAAKCMDIISIPLASITIEYCQKVGNTELVRKMEAEIADVKMRRDEHLRHAKINWQKAKENKKQISAERAKIDKFIAEWAPHYPDRFYDFGIYRNVFREHIDILRDQGEIADALLLEADASDMCVRQYADVTVKYFRERAEEAGKANDKSMVQESRRQLEAYQKVRDEHLKRSAMLRALAKQNPKNWPPVADKRDFSTPQSKHKITADRAIKLTREDKRIQQILEEHRNIREYAWFQGFCWTVSYYTRDWGNLAIVFVDDETGKVTDVLVSPGNLEEERERDEEEERKLKLSPEEVIEIAKKHPKVKSYFNKHPDARANAAYNWRYKCWIIEVILGDSEVGIVSVSDKTGEVLEVALGQER